MKLDEIRNKLFDLSDLRGLIKENAFDEGIGKWDKFFIDHPEYLDQKYDRITPDEFLADLQLRRDLADIDGGATSKIYPDNDLSQLRGQERKDLLKKYYKGTTGGFMTKRQQALGSREKYKGNYELKQDKIIDRVTNLPNIELLRDFFTENGGNGFVYSNNFNESAEYFNGLNDMSDKAYEFFMGKGLKIDTFNDSGLKVGNCTDPFSMFLLFYFVKYCYGGKNGSKKDSYIENVTPGFPKEYVKYLIGKENIFTIIKKSNPDSAAEIFNTYGFGDVEMAPFRSFVYFKKYMDKYPNTNLGETDIEKIASVFRFSKDILFDPLSKIANSNIMFGFQTLCSNRFNEKSEGNPTQALGFLEKQTLVQDVSKNGAPIENIFMMAKTIAGLLKIDFSKDSKFGTSGKNVLGFNVPVTQKIEILFSDANKGVKLLEDDAIRRGKKMPRHIDDLRTLCNSKIKKEKSFKFWQLLARDSGTKTQDAVLAFLMSVSDPDIEWEDDEYNRFNKVEREQLPDGLGDKSIDIMGTKVENGKEIKLCFEYQGEQHAHPVCLKQTDYDYALYTAMNDAILTKCGFTSLNENGKIKYYAGHENLDKQTVMEAIIAVFSEYADLLDEELRNKTTNYGDVITPRFNITPKKNDVVAEGSKLGRKLYLDVLSKYKVEQAAKYFRWVCTKGKNNPEIFEASSLNGEVPYLCSPVRFMDEVLVAQGRQRDIVKNEIIRRRRRAGWEMAYIVPEISSKFTEEDLNYTIKYVANGCEVFKWNNEGKESLIDFLYRKGFRTINESKIKNRVSLFEEIINELLTSDSLLLQV